MHEKLLTKSVKVRDLVTVIDSLKEFFPDEYIVVGFEVRHSDGEVFCKLADSTNTVVGVVKEKEIATIKAPYKDISPKFEEGDIVRLIPPQGGTGVIQKYVFDHYSMGSIRASVFGVDNGNLHHFFSRDLEVVPTTELSQEEKNKILKQVDTYTAKFIFPNGETFEIPSPEGYEECEVINCQGADALITDISTHTTCTVIDCYQLGEIYIRHENGRISLHDFTKRIVKEGAILDNIRIWKKLPQEEKKEEDLKTPFPLLSKYLV